MINKVILKVAEQASGTRKHQPPVWQFFDYELVDFANLIIKNCIAEIAMVSIQNFENEDIQWAVERSIINIKNRFGLNEQSN